MTIKFQPSFVKFAKGTACVVAALSALVLLWYTYSFLLTAIVLTIIVAMVLISAYAVIRLLWLVIFTLIPKVARLVVYWPPSPPRRFPRRPKIVTAIATIISVCASLGFAVMHLQMQKRVAPIYEKFKESAWCGPYRAGYDKTTIEERDQIIAKHGFVLVPLTGWYVRCDSKLPFTDGRSNTAVYLRIPWR